MRCKTVQSWSISTLMDVTNDMDDSSNPLNHNAISGLLNDPIMIRMVTVVNLTSLSILELLEYGFTRKDISRAMAKEVIEFDKPLASESPSRGDVASQILETGDYYFELLSRKVRLAKLGLFLLEITEVDEDLANMPWSDVVQHGEEDTLLHQKVPHV